MTLIGSFEKVFKFLLSVDSVHLAEFVDQRILFATLFVMILTALPESIIADVFFPPFALPRLMVPIYELNPEKSPPHSRQNHHHSLNRTPVRTIVDSSLYSLLILHHHFFPAFDRFGLHLIFEFSELDSVTFLVCDIFWRNDP